MKVAGMIGVFGSGSHSVGLVPSTVNLTLSLFVGRAVVESGGSKRVSPVLLSSLLNIFDLDRVGEAEK